MSELQDRALAVNTMEQINTLFQEELGYNIDDVYLRFDDEPIAVASIAEVHKAILKDGTRVAVKIQHPHLQRVLQYDMDTIALMFQLLKFSFPETDLSWILPEFKDSLEQELDFRL